MEGQWNDPLINLLLANAKYVQLLYRFESEESFSFTSADNIHSVARLLKVSYRNHVKHVNFLNLFLVVPVRSSRTAVSALFDRISPLYRA